MLVIGHDNEVIIIPLQLPRIVVRIVWRNVLRDEIPAPVNLVVQLLLKCDKMLVALFIQVLKVDIHPLHAVLIKNIENASDESQTALRRFNDPVNIRPIPAFIEVIRYHRTYAYAMPAHEIERRDIDLRHDGVNRIGNKKPLRKDHVHPVNILPEGGI